MNLFDADLLRRFTIKNVSNSIFRLRLSFSSHLSQPLTAFRSQHLLRLFHAKLNLVSISSQHSNHNQFSVPNPLSMPNQPSMSNQLSTPNQPSLPNQLSNNVSLHQVLMLMHKFCVAMLL